MTVPELEELGVLESAMAKITKIIRDHREYIDDYTGDVLLDGAAPYYQEVVQLIDDALTASESAESSQRIQDFSVSCLTDLIQVALVTEMDHYRSIVREGLVTKEADSALDALAILSLPHSLRKKKKAVKASREKWEGVDQQQLLEILFAHTEHMVHEVLPKIRQYSEDALKTSNLTQLGKMNTKPEDYMSGLMSEYMEKVENENLIPYPEPEKLSETSSKQLQS